MTYFIKSLISIILAIGILFATIYIADMDTIKNVNNQTQCEKVDTSTGKCQLWLGNKCWKGTCDGSYDKGTCSCVKKTNIGALLLIILSGCFMISFFYFLVQAFRHKNDNAAMGFCSSRISDE